MRILGALTTLFAAYLLGILGFPSYSPPTLRILVTAFALVGVVAGVLLLLGRSQGGWSARLALAFLLSVVVFGLLLLIQGVPAPETLGPPLRYNVFTSLPAAVLAILLYRELRASALAG
jgi:hypothetical protein